MLAFACIEILPLLGKLWKMFRGGEAVKQKVKALGGFSESDPLRSLVMRESIYSLSFMVSLGRKTHEKLGIPEESMPSKLIRWEVALCTYFCAFCQIFTSYLLLQDFFKQNEDSESEDSGNEPKLE